MTLGMMQPYFYPYLGYFALIRASDTWVVFDDAQYMRHGWVDRNRILHPNEGWQYIKVELEKAPRDTPIREMRCKSGDWADRILRQLIHYKKRAPHYAAVTELLASTFRGAPDRLDELLVHTLRATCTYLGLPFDPIANSTLDYDRAAIGGPGDWARVTAKHLGAKRYVNPPGGREIFHPELWRRDGIELRFLTMPAIPYRQLREGFEEHLSIVDVMMFVAPEQIRAMLDQATISE